MEHRCGGTLTRQSVKINKKVGFFFQSFTVDGLKCDRCGDEIISRDSALEIDRAIARLRDLWRNWRVPADTEVTFATAQMPTGTYVQTPPYLGSNHVRQVHP
jgi:hypothetical protein